MDGDFAGILGYLTAAFRTGRALGPDASLAFFAFAEGDFHDWWFKERLEFVKQCHTSSDEEYGADHNK